MKPMGRRIARLLRPAPPQTPRFPTSREKITYIMPKVPPRLAAGVLFIGSVRTAKAHTAPHRKAVLADGGVNRLTIEQALSVPQAHTMPRRQAGPGGVLADGK